MASVKCVSRWALGVPALAREVEPGEVVEVTDDQFAGMANQAGVWEVEQAPEGWTKDEAGWWSAPAAEPPADPPAVDPPAADPPKTRGRQAAASTDNQEVNPNGAAV